MQTGRNNRHRLNMHRRLLPTQMRKLAQLNLADLDEAFEHASEVLRYYLDLETGQVAAVTAEIREELEAIYEAVYDEGEEEAVAFDEALRQRDLPEWMRHAIEEAHQIEQGYSTRFIAIPEADSRESYRDMERFTDSIGDTRLQAELLRALQGRGAFRRFKDVLLARPAERERWFAFSIARVRERVLEWLESEGIEARNG